MRAREHENVGAREHENMRAQDHGSIRACKLGKNLKMSIELNQVRACE